MHKVRTPFEILPAAQEEQDAAPLYDEMYPSAQAVHAEALVEEYFPDSHAAQLLIAIVPMNDPAAQSVHADDPEEDIVPARQLVQTSIPAVAAIFPASQAVHTSEPAEPE